MGGIHCPRNWRAIALGPGKLDGPEDVLGTLLSHPWERCNSAVLDGRLKCFDGGDVQFFPDSHNCLWSKARDLYEVENPLWKLGLETLEVAHLAGVDQLCDLRRDGLADAGDLCKVLTLSDHGVDVSG